MRGGVAGKETVSGVEEGGVEWSLEIFVGPVRWHVGLVSGGAADVLEPGAIVFWEVDEVGEGGGEERSKGKNLSGLLHHI